MESNSDSSQRLMRRRDLSEDSGDDDDQVDDNNHDVDDDDDDNHKRHASRRRRLRTNNGPTRGILLKKKWIGSHYHNHNNNHYNNNNNKTSSLSSSRFVEYRNAATRMSHHPSYSSSSSSYHHHHRSSLRFFSKCSPVTLVLIVFVGTAATVGVLEWMYLDQIPLMQHQLHIPYHHPLSSGVTRRTALSTASSVTSNGAAAATNIAAALFPNNNNNNNNNNNGVQVAKQGDFEPESRKLDQPLEMVMQQFGQYIEPPQEELSFEDTTTDYVRDPDKEPILKILRQAGVDTDELEKSVYDQLPTWSQVQELFGTKPIIYGMGEHGENCEAFRNNTDPTIRFFGIAGMFNSGTNLLASLMIQNCQITERMLVYGEQSKGVRWQVPWGKHTPARYRMEHLTRTDKDVPVSNSLPLVTIRDPYQWMQSMCRHPYTVRGMHDELTCPHLIHSSYKPSQQNTPITREDLNNIDVYYSNVIVRHATLAHFWNDWYHQYMEADFPRIFVRYEDLLFYAQEVTEQLCACGGGVPRRPEFTHIQDSAKVGHMAHGHVKTNLVEAMIRYGNFKHRLDHLTPLDIEIAKQLFDTKLMTMFNYHHPNSTFVPATQR